MPRRAKLWPKCRGCRVAKQVGGCLFGCTPKQRVTRELKLLITSEKVVDPILERLEKCPEAYGVGEALEKALHRIDGANMRLLPSAGAVVPPFA